MNSRQEPEVSGIILAGGASSRLGRNKALFELDGTMLIERVVRALAPLVQTTIIVTNTPEPFASLHLPCVADTFPDVGVLGGLHAGLSAISTEYAVVVGCDMPFLSQPLLRYIMAQRQGVEVVMPRIDTYAEPLHAVYARRCRVAFERHIRAGERRVQPACRGLKTRFITEAEIRLFDPDRLSFLNVNTPADLRRVRALLSCAEQVSAPTSREDP